VLGSLVALLLLLPEAALLPATVLLLVGGTVVRKPLSPPLSLYCRGLLLCAVRVLWAWLAGAGSGAGVAAGSGIGAAAGAGCAGSVLAAVCAAPTVRLLTTVFTPLTCAASLAAAVRVESLATLPESVTTPLFELMVICFSGTLLSALILF
jgi:hypothetical protein